jgi:hypothetical protein
MHFDVSNGACVLFDYSCSLLSAAFSAMSPVPVTIELDAELGYSVTYDPSDDSVTVHLPDAKPIEHVKNKARLMLLIYFVQHDLRRRSGPRKIDPNIATEVKLVERIVKGFSNLKQALRTLKEYTTVGGHVDTSKGLIGTRDRSNAARSVAITMTVTPEIKDVITDWFRDILAGEVCVLNMIH